MNKYLEVGTKVILDIGATTWSEGPCNPFGVEGVVTPDDFDSWVGVLWDNGIHNKYKPNDQDLIAVENKDA